jgi:hypothetical protein
MASGKTVPAWPILPWFSVQPKDDLVRIALLSRRNYRHLSDIASMNPITSDTSPTGPEAIELQMSIRRPDEDWSGITDRAVRKRLQNRLNQRAQRKSLNPCD